MSSFVFFGPPGSAPATRPATLRRRQLRDPHQVVRGTNEESCELGLHPTNEARLAEATDSFHPAPDLLDELSLPLAHGVASVARRSAAHGRAAALGNVLRDVRRHVEHTEVGNEVLRVVA